MEVPYANGRREKVFLHEERHGCGEEGCKNVWQENVLHQEEEKVMAHGKKHGLYENIRLKKARIKAGSKERMRKPGTKGAPTAAAFKAAAKTAKKPKAKKRARKA